MTRDELLKVLNNTLDETAHIAVLHVKDDLGEVPRWRADLTAALVDPPQLIVATAGAHAKSCKVTQASIQAYALARKDLGWNDSWLLYDPETGLFWLAWGRDPSSLELSGFDGHDPLEVWHS